jgi:hypothetical protein
VIGCRKNLQQDWHSHVAGSSEPMGARSTRRLVCLGAQRVNQNPQGGFAATRACHTESIYQQNLPELQLAR